MNVLMEEGCHDEDSLTLILILPSTVPESMLGILEVAGSME